MLVEFVDLRRIAPDSTNWLDLAIRLSPPGGDSTSSTLKRGSACLVPVPL
jgi:hypothetical protein